MFKKIQRTLVCASIVFTTASEGHAAQEPILEYLPKGCHALKYSVGLFNKQEPKTKSNYEKIATISKTDVLCIGENISIDKDLHTNGGDIIVWAENLQINAKIDTRIYIDHGKIDYSQNGSTLPDGTTEIKNSDLFNQEKYESPNLGVERYAKSYERYYLECNDCVKSQDNNVLPQLPSGLTPTRTYKKGQNPPVKNGLPPPDDLIDFTSARSGNAYIFASRISIASSLDGSPTQSEQNCQNTPPQKFNFAINTSGLYGGRGGAGTPSSCITSIPGRSASNPSFSYSCKDQASLIDSGHTGPGGKGGNAGSIRVFAVNSDIAQIKALLTNRTNIQGGLPGNSGKFRSPTAGGDLQTTGEYCDFRRTMEGSWPPEKQGEAGVIGVSPESTNSALIELGKLLRAKASRLDYNFSDLAERASKNDSISNITFDDHFESSLARMLSRAQSNVISATDKLFSDGKIINEIASGQSITDLRAQNLDTNMFTARQLVFLRELGAFSGAGIRPNNRMQITINGKTKEIPSENSPENTYTDLLSSYLLKSGGMLNISNSDPYGRFVAEATRIDVKSSKESLDEIKNSLIGVNEKLASLDLREELRDRKIQLNLLATNISNLEIELSKAENQGLFSDKILGAARDFGSATSAALASYTSSDWIGLLSSLAKIQSTADQLSNLFSVTNFQNEKLSALRKQYELVEKSYLSLIQKISENREAYLSEKLRSLKDILDSRVSFNKRLDSRFSQFHDLLRLSIISYISDPASDIELFRSNLSGVKTFVNDFPKTEPYFRFRSSKAICPAPMATTDSNAMTKCISISGSRNWQVVNWKVTLSNSDTLYIPLFTIAPSNSEKQVNLFNLNHEIKVLPEHLISWPTNKIRF